MLTTIRHRRMESNHRDGLVYALLGVAVFLLDLSPAIAVQPRPNVIVVMTDDQGYGDLGVKGNPLIKTPNLDAFAAQSAEMLNFYVHPVCAPTRACLMTGRYNYRTRCIDTYVGRAMMDTDEVTVAEILRSAGYRTGIFGKWHLGDNYPMRPMDQGFEESLVHRGGGIGQPSDPPGGSSYFDPLLVHNGKVVTTQGYCTDVYFEAAIRWMDVHHEEPFFAYIPTNAPHSPFQVDDNMMAPYKGADLNHARFPQSRGHKLPGSGNARKEVYAMITNIDDNFGKLMQFLDRRGLSENTIVCFLHDNGPNGRRYVRGYRGRKGEIYEAGIRSPLFIRWTGRIRPGQTSDRIAAHIDLLPTILAACDVPRPEGLSLDGRSLLPLLLGESVGWPDRTLFFQWHRGDVPVLYHHFAARSQDWKLLHATRASDYGLRASPEFELYHLSEDPFEEHDVAAREPAMLSRLKGQYEAWFTDVGKSRGYDPPRIYLGTPHENPVVLTRQDWRCVSDGSGWEADALGYWEVLVARRASYGVRFRFPPKNVQRTATLEVAGASRTQELAPGVSWCSFRLQLPAGPTRLEAMLHEGDAVQGPFQVDVIAEASVGR